MNWDRDISTKKETPRNGNTMTNKGREKGTEERCKYGAK